MHKDIKEIENKAGIKVRMDRFFRLLLIHFIT